MRISIIGNNANGASITDGGRIKLRLFKTLLEAEGHNVDVIELDNWKKRIFKIVKEIRRAINKKNTIIIMAGPNGCRKIIPLVYQLNKKNHSRVVFCPVGIGTFDKLVRKMPLEKVDAFINCKNFYGVTDNKMKKYLNSFSFVCPENDIQNNLYKSFYDLSNTVVINNFRNEAITGKEFLPFKGRPLNIVFMGRVKAYKGIFDLIECVLNVNKSRGRLFCLDIYGDIQLTEEEKIYFSSLLNDGIRYCGLIETSESISVLKKYDLFCLPTKYYGEGTSGALVESLIAGTPVLTSSYSQVDNLIKDNVNGYIFKINSLDDLKNKLLEISENAQRTAIKFTYEGIKKDFLKVFVGE